MKITVKNLQKKIKTSNQTLLLIKKTILKTLKSESSVANGEITICLVDNKNIAGLNLRYFKKNNPTDVLAFDLSENINYKVADIIISAETAASNAEYYKTTLVKELLLYAIHGMLHLLGFSDRTKEQRKLMMVKAKNIINQI